MPVNNSIAQTDSTLYVAPPASPYQNLVQELYIAYFGRPADYFGLQNFESALAAANAPTDIGGLVSAYSTNFAIKALVDSFGTSAESAALYGSGSTESFVTAIFENLLNRAPAVSGLTYWTYAINSGSVSKGDAALAIAAAALSQQGINSLDYQTLTNKIVVASQFTADLGASASDIVGYSGATAALQARTFLANITSTTVVKSAENIAAVQATVDTIVNGPSVVAPPPVAITQTVDSYNSSAGVGLSGSFIVPQAQSGVVNGYQANVLSYTISSTGVLSFTGTLAPSLTAEQMAGDAAVILKNFPNTAVTFNHLNPTTHTADTFVYAHTATGAANLVDLVGQSISGIGGSSGVHLVDTSGPGAPMFSINSYSM